MEMPSSSPIPNEQMTATPARDPDIGLALSGGGSRAIAFHLGCLRALDQRGVLQRVGVLSAVSGGSVVAALYAYHDDHFDVFEKRVLALLRRGLHGDVLKSALSPLHAAQSVTSSIVAGVAAKVAQTAKSIGWARGLLPGANPFVPSLLSRVQPPFPRWESRTSAFEMVLSRKHFRGATMERPARNGLHVILNATDLRTGTAFRFGSRNTSSYRYGIVSEPVSVATAVAASAAYPVLLPSLHKRFVFRQRDGTEQTHRVVLTDGGVYDNLAASSLDPTRNPDYTHHVYPTKRLVCCVASPGRWSGDRIPFGWASRMRATVEVALRRGDDQAMKHLHQLRRSEHLDALVLPYLGGSDENLECAVGRLPDDFVSREQVASYPTDFAAMTDATIERLSRRGEQLTSLLLAKYW